LQAKAIEQLTARVEELEAENAELRRRLGLNSTNSSKPPSCGTRPASAERRHD
jgi:cell shape-determining protein MreC